MRYLSRKGIGILVVLSLLLVWSCNDDDETSTLLERGVALNFAIQEGFIQENDNGGITINIAFLAKTLEAGSVNIEVLPQDGLMYGTDFTTDPEPSSGILTLNLPVGSTQAAFTVFPQSISGEDETKSILFRIESATGGVFVGTQDEFVLSITDEPIITVNGDLTDFGNVEQGFSSASQSYTVSAVSLAEDVLITAPDHYLLSTDNGNFSSTLSLPSADFDNGEITIYVILSPEVSASLGAAQGSISHASAGAVTKTLDVMGNIIVPVPEIRIDASLSDFGNVPPGQQSASQSYTVEGHALSENVVINAPANFEVSTDDMTFSSSLTLDYTAIEGVPTTIFVRFAPTVIGAISEDITHASTGADPQNLTVTGTGEDLSVPIASTSFEEPVGGTGYTDLVNNDVDHDLVNNPGDAPVDYVTIGSELGFDATFISTRVFNTPNGLDDEPIGVLNAPPFGVASFTDGVQGYSFSDTDGIIKVTLDAVDLTGFTETFATLDIFIVDTTYEVTNEAPDRVRITAVVDGGAQTLTLLDLESENPANDFPNYDSLGAWRELRVDLTGFTSVELVIEVDVNTNSEGVLVDNVQFRGIN